MRETPGNPPLTTDRRLIARRRVLQTIVSAAGAGVAARLVPGAAFAQGRCMLTPGTASCNTSDIPPAFEPTGWKTVALDHVAFRVADPQKEAAFYAALMGWTPRAETATETILDIGDWGSARFRQEPGTSRALVQSFAFVIDPWNAKTVETELRKRGLDPVADDDGNGFESFHVKDPDGFDLQLCNGGGLAKARRTPSAATLVAPPPFASTGWKTVWLDHFSFSVTNYKATASFYMNLLGWKPTYDEGSQNECLMADVGDIIIRGGNPLDPAFGRGGRGPSTPLRPDGATAAGPRARVDHISFGITPWDTDGVRAELETRGLRVQIDTSSRHRGPDGTWVPDEIHTAAFKSYHTDTPNGYNLQISNVTHDTRLTLSNAVRPKTGGV